MAKKPILPLAPVAYEEKTYHFPSLPVLIWNPRPHCFIPMGVMQIGGHEVYVKDPDGKAYPTYELAKAFLDQQLQGAKEELRPKLYVPPGRGKVQA